LTQAWVDKNFGQGVQLGSRAFLPLPAGGMCGLLQAQPNSMPKEAMEIKERQMVALGARLIEQQQVQRTATEAKIEHASEVSVLGTCANNLAAAYVAALKWCGAFVGSNDVSEFKLDPDAELRKLTSEERKQLMAEWQGKGITTSEYRQALVRGGVATLDDEKYKDEIESEPPAFTPGQAGATTTPPPSTPESTSQ
jgi:hypothetical protein